ncbi:MAG TPA: LPXTG cell wall anchor domain-containing protein [Micromonosporaceae bacterium]|jgi:LPXTG-motif cell wall-anchored protein
MRRIAAALTALGLAALASLAVAAPASAADPVVAVGSVTGAPDNDPPGTPACDTWARDTFTRTTTITESGTADVYDIHQEIDGTWVSTTNTAIKGTITGHLDYTVTGTLVADVGAVDDDIDLSGFDCKTAVPDGPDKSTKWALRYFTDGATAGTLSDWEYVYDTACDDPYTEDEQADESGHPMGPDVFTEVCPEPTRTKTTVPTTTNPGSEGTLPKTGSNVTVIAGVAVLLIVGGVVTLAAVRRRATR